MLTDPRFLSENLSDDARAAFFASGEADVDRIFRLDELRAAPPPSSALDFGCGVGRLTSALVRRVEHVVGVDVSETMLGHARGNVPGATFHTTIPDETFDLILSLIVLQHIPVSRGMAILRELVAHMGSGGALVLQVPVSRPGGTFRRLARVVRAQVPLVHRLASRLEGNGRGLPYMEMNPYDLSTLRSEIERENCVIRHAEPADHGGIQGVLMVARKL